jgi:hypothetical protein
VLVFFLDGLLAAVVTSKTKALPIAGIPEDGPVTTVRDDVIHYSGPDNQTPALTVFA